MKFKNSYEVIALIEQKKRNGIALRQLKSFMESVGNPHLQLKCIHIGGTNGKGSTTNMVATILKEAGYIVGSFTSPYLETHHDRIRINDRFIEDEAIVEYANQYYDEWVKYDLSMFEIDMFIATMYFLKHHVDFAVYEVGLGGNQDATNIIDPIVSAITNIGLDHVEFLGTTYEEIAHAKAGIIKTGRALITNEQKAECLHIFQQQCAEKHCEFIQCAPINHLIVTDELIFDYKNYLQIKQQTYAVYQAYNTVVAVEIIDYLKKHGFIKMSQTVMYDGIHKAIWKGRFEVIHKKPLVIIDGAHNSEGMDALVSSCKPFKKIKILFTALKDKPYHMMLEKLLGISNDVTICEFDFYRAAKAKDIANGFPVHIEADYQKAIDTMMTSAKDDEMILICGSLYFISDVREYITKKAST